MADEERSRKWSWKRWTLIGVAAAVVLFVGGPFVYIHFIQGPAPAPLTLGTPTSGGRRRTTRRRAAGDPAADGTWTAGGDSVVGYRIQETIFGQSNVAVGRTGAVTGTLTIAGVERDRREVHRRHGDRHERREPPRRPVQRPDHGDGHVPDRDVRADEADRPGIHP